MNKNILLLGMLLVAGISFAADPLPENWMQSVQGRYDCNMNYYDDLAGIADSWGMGTEDQQDDLYAYITDLTHLSWSDMYEDAGCGSYIPSVSAFRSDMASFNGILFSFKQVFNPISRDYLVAHPTDRADVLDDINSARGEYFDCISDDPFCRSP